MQKVVKKDAKLEDDSNINKLLRLSNISNYITVIIVSLIIAIIVSIFFWTKSSGYGVLYNRLSDEDEGSIITKLSEMNIPYRLNEKSGTILVPDDIIYQLRLNLAKNGFPKGSGIGFELLDKQGFGISQFNEQINYQRALEGELSRTIQKLDAIKYARVHLGSFPSAFFLDKQKEPSVGIILELQKGRMLSFGQVQSIVHLVSCSISDLKESNITIIDQYGHLLNQSGKEYDDLHNLRYRYCNELEHTFSRKVAELLFPLFGSENVRTQVTAELDFNVKNLIEEKYDPNFLNQVKSIRSRQELTNKEPSKVIDLDRHVIPKKSNAESKGILNNIIKKSKNKNILNKNTIGTANDTWANNKVMYGHNCKNSTTHSEATVNYELNHTVVHTKLERGTIKRLSIAVVVNYIKNAHGKLVPLNVMQIDQIKKLTQAAVGYSEARGDTVSIVNSLFFKPKINDVNIIKSTNNILVSHVYLKRICLISLFIVVICFLSYLILAKIFRNRNINKINHLNNSKFDNDNHLRQNETKLNKENEFFNNEYNLYSTQYNSIQDIEKLRKYDSEVIAKIIKYWIHKSL